MALTHRSSKMMEEGAGRAQPGRATRREGVQMAPPAYGVACVDGGAVQARGGLAGDTAEIHRVAREGLSGPPQRLPFADVIQRSFGRHDIRHVSAHVDADAARANCALGTQAYASGPHVAFRTTPDLHTAAHEAAHVVQQAAGVHLAGGVGRPGDTYERQADAVADLVVQGARAEERLGPAGVGFGFGSGVHRAPPPGPCDAGNVQMKVHFSLRNPEEALRSGIVNPDLPEIEDVIPKDKLAPLTDSQVGDFKLELLYRLALAQGVDRVIYAIYKDLKAAGRTTLLHTKRDAKYVRDALQKKGCDPGFYDVYANVESVMNNINRLITHGGTYNPEPEPEEAPWEKDRGPAARAPGVHTYQRLADAAWEQWRSKGGGTATFEAPTADDPLGKVKNYQKDQAEAVLDSFRNASQWSLEQRNNVASQFMAKYWTAMKAKYEPRIVQHFDQMLHDINVTGPDQFAFFDGKNERVFWAAPEKIFPGAKSNEWKKFILGEIGILNDAHNEAAWSLLMDRAFKQKYGQDWSAVQRELDAIYGVKGSADTDSSADVGADAGDRDADERGGSGSGAEAPHIERRKASPPRTGRKSFATSAKRWLGRNVSSAMAIGGALLGAAKLVYIRDSRQPPKLIPETGATLPDSRMASGKDLPSRVQELQDRYRIRD